MLRCEGKGCGRERISVMRRLNGQYLCADCNQDRVRAMTPTRLVHNEQRITYGLYRFFIDCGLSRGDALEKLAFSLAGDPAMFTRMISTLDELRETK